MLIKEEKARKAIKHFTTFFQQAKLLPSARTIKRLRILVLQRLILFPVLHQSAQAMSQKGPILREAHIPNPVLPKVIYHVP